MTRKVIHSKVGPDGVLHLEVPMGTDEANREVRTIVEDAGRATAPPKTQEEWQDFLRRTAGTSPTRISGGMSRASSSSGNRYDAHARHKFLRRVSASGLCEPGGHGSPGRETTRFDALCSVVVEELLFKASRSRDPSKVETQVSTYSTGCTPSQNPTGTIWLR